MSNSTSQEVHEIAGGQIVVWSEPGGPIMLKTREPHGDPVELAEHEVRDLIELLQRLVDLVD